MLDTFFGGGSQTENDFKTLRFDVANETTWQMGRYALGFGWRVRGEFLNQVSRSNFGGTYTFSGRLAPVLDANNNPATDAAGNVVSSRISSLESYRRTLLFRGLAYSDERIRALGGGANQFTVSGGNPQIKAAQYNIGFYVQNSYKLSETVAASFGVRYENQTNLSSNYNFTPLAETFNILNPAAAVRPSPALPVAFLRATKAFSSSAAAQIPSAEVSVSGRVSVFNN